MKQNRWIAGTGVAFALCGAVLMFAARNNAAPSQGSPVLVELFTSEGCSSCPPADALLESIDRAAAASGPDAVVLSEHVDYWNQLGWTDPYSSARFSERQKAYADRMHLDSPYTPEMVIDGIQEFVGSDGRKAAAAIAQSALSEKAVVRVTPQPIDGSDGLRVRIEVDPLPPSLHSSNAEVYLAVALNEATSQVLRGENGGHRLHHVAVVRSLNVIGKVNHGGAFTKEVSVPLKDLRANQVRLVAFVQEKGEGKVLGVAEHAATP